MQNKYLKLDKDKLMDLLHQRDMIIKKQTNSLNNRQVLIRHFRIRLYKIRNELDYLISHPQSVDNNYTTRTHTRDKHKNKKGVREWIKMKKNLKND